MRTDYHVIRLDVSSYMDEHFLRKEAQMVADLGMSYSRLGQEHVDITKSPIFITSSQSNLDGHLITGALPQGISPLFCLHPNSGYENLKSPTMPIVTGRQIRAEAVADFHMAALLNWDSPLFHRPDWPKKRLWPTGRRRQHSTVAILGMGHVGTLLAKKLENFSRFKVISFDPKNSGDATLEDVLAQADALCVCASLETSNVGLLDHKTLSLLKEHCFISNPARGQHIVYADLIAWLKKNPLASAVLDVHEQEPYTVSVPNELGERLIFTPHIAGVWQGLLNSMLVYEKQVLEDFLKDPHELGFLKGYDRDHNVYERPLK